MQRTTHTAVIFASIAASVATLGLALLPAMPSAVAPEATAEVLRTVELPRVVVSGVRELRVVELERVVVQGQRIAAPAASVAGLAQPLQPLLARQPN